MSDQEFGSQDYEMSQKDPFVIDKEDGSQAQVEEERLSASDDGVLEDMNTPIEPKDQDKEQEDEEPDAPSISQEVEENKKEEKEQQTCAVLIALAWSDETYAV